MIDAVAKKLRRFFPLTVRQVHPERETDLASHAVFPDGFHGTNPSFVPCGDGYLICLRGVNYRLSGPNMAEPIFVVGSRYMTVNRFFLVDRAFRLQRALPGLDAVFDDVEDIKLFEFQGRIMGSGSSADPAGAPGNRAIFLLTLDLTTESGTRRLLASPFGLAVEKNWSPFVHQGVLHFLYSFDPLIVLRYEPAKGGVAFVDPAAAAAARNSLRFLVGGSSAGLPAPGGFLFVAHRRRISLPRMHRSYVSLVYHLDAAAMALTAGRYFSIGSPCVQFVNGLAEQGESLLLSYGRMDRSGHVCRIPKASLLPRRPSRAAGGYV